MSTLPFEKVEGLGNDFVLVRVASEAALDLSSIPRICDRRRGVGADGVLLLLPPRAGADARMKVVNADGSVPEMCGNGLRCVALELARERGMRRGELRIETDAGVRTCQVRAEDDDGTVSVDMGVVRVTGRRTLTVGGESVDLTLADAGNPHAVAYRASPEDDVETIGQAIATHSSFERGTNAELVRWRGELLEVAVWERGAGRTQACGTGACAVVAVACARGEAASGARVRLRLPGGELFVTHDTATGGTIMVGPARRAFRGEWRT